MAMAPAPIVLFVYNRPMHAQRTVAALARNRLAPESDLVVFADGPRSDADAENVRAVRAAVKTSTGFRSVTCIERDRNLGLANSIISGVTEVVARSGRVIVLEDDMVTSPHFLDFMNDGLECYRDQHDVVSIHGYLYPLNVTLPETFFLRGADCWGWATWKRGWELFEPDGRRSLEALRARGLAARFDYDGTFGFTRMLENQVLGRNDSWAIRWAAAAFLHDKLTLYPGRSLVRNIGTDASGTHCAVTDDYETLLADRALTVRRIPVEESRQAYAALKSFFRSLQSSRFERSVSFLKQRFTGTH